MTITSRSRILSLSLAVVFCCPALSWSQSGEHKSDVSSADKRRLHANLKAERGWYGDPRLETLTFRLTNDSDETLDSATASWVLVIDDREVADRGGQLWAGPKPTGGYGTVRPGETLQFGKGLPLGQYFPEARDYKIYWKAAGFRSNVVVVRGGTTP
jgi:hypothetical protein